MSPARSRRPVPALRTRPGPVPWTEDRIRALGVVTDLPTAAKILGLGRALAYQLARDGTFPVPVLRAGTRYRVPVASLLAALHLAATPDTITGESATAAPSAGDLITRAQSSVDHADNIGPDGPHPTGAVLSPGATSP